MERPSARNVPEPATAPREAFEMSDVNPFADRDARPNVRSSCALEPTISTEIFRATLVGPLVHAVPHREELTQADVLPHHVGTLQMEVVSHPRRPHQTRVLLEGTDVVGHAGESAGSEDDGFDSEDDEIPVFFSPSPNAGGPTASSVSESTKTTSDSDRFWTVRTTRSTDQSG